MSKKGYISRFLLIVKKLQIKPYSSFEDIRRYIDLQLDYLQMQDDTLIIGFSKRTLQRDIREIRNLFGIDITYSRARKGYVISPDQAENMNFQRMMEAFDMFQSLNLAQDLRPYIHLEQRRPQGTENLSGLLHAIKNRLLVRFDYRKFWDDDISRRALEPYALKEFKNRWYVLGRDAGAGAAKHFGLDRLSKLEITNQNFIYPENYSVEQNHRFSFGIMGANDKHPQEIILSFDPFQGKYIKTLPLHHTQEIMIDNQKELRIKLTLFLTHDLLMELLSYGAKLKVIAPKSLAEQVKQAHQEAFNRYRV